MSHSSIRPEFAASTSVVRPGVVLVAFTGDLDRDAVGQATALLVAATAGGAEHLVLDLSRVIFMGSDGISLLIAAHQQRHGISGRLHVIGIADNRQVLRPLELMNLTGMLHVERDLDQVLAGLD